VDDSSPATSGLLLIFKFKLRIWRFNAGCFRRKTVKLAEFRWQDILPEEEHETEALLARSSISETQATAEIVIPEAGQL